MRICRVVRDVQNRALESWCGCRDLVCAGREPHDSPGAIRNRNGAPRCAGGEILDLQVGVWYGSACRTKNIAPQLPYRECDAWGECGECHYAASIDGHSTGGATANSIPKSCSVSSCAI